MWPTLQFRAKFGQLGRRADGIDLHTAIAEISDIPSNSYAYRDVLREVAISDSLNYAGNMKPLRDSCVCQFVSSREQRRILPELFGCARAFYAGWLAHKTKTFAPRKKNAKR